MLVGRAAQGTQPARGRRLLAVAALRDGSLAYESSCKEVVVIRTKPEALAAAKNIGASFLETVEIVIAFVTLVYFSWREVYQMYSTRATELAMPEEPAEPESSAALVLGRRRRRTLYIDPIDPHRHPSLCSAPTTTTLSCHPPD